ncbi:MAG TPA: hypothetical protein VF244_10600 [Acidimicrobiales bacterium]
MNPAAALAAAPLPVWLAVAAAGVWWPDGFYYFVAEDHVFEWIQVGAFAVAAAGCGAVAVSVRRVSRAAAVIAALWCALFVVVVGEEVAWGQRVLGVSVPAIERVNDQGDVSLHNVGPGLALSNLGILGIALAGALSRPAARWWATGGGGGGGHGAGRPARTVRPEFLPPSFVGPWFALAAAFTAVRLAWPSPPARVAKFSEVAELTVALAAAITALKLARATSTSARNDLEESSPRNGFARHPGPGAGRL